MLSFAGFSPNFQVMAGHRHPHRVLVQHRSPTSHHFERPASHYGYPLRPRNYDPLSEHSYHLSVRDEFPIPTNVGASDTMGREHSQEGATGNFPVLVPGSLTPLVRHPEYNPHCSFVPPPRPANRGYPPPACPYYQQYHRLLPNHSSLPHSHGLGHHSAHRPPHGPGHCRQGQPYPSYPYHPGPR